MRSLLLVLLLAGCAQKINVKELEARGCKLDCTACINLRMVCADAVDAKGIDEAAEAGKPGTGLEMLK